MPQTASARLRTKTGCLTCRSRRKKCDETYPHCRRCTGSKRRCQWPSIEDLIDRRHVSRRGSTTPSSPPPSRCDSASPKTTALVVSVSTPTLSLQSEDIACQIVRRDVEPLVSANFFDKYFDMIVLPNCHPQFYHGWIGELKELMTRHPSLYYSMLACSASQVHSLSGTAQLHGLSLEYYDKSIRYVSQLLNVDSVANHNGLLMSIILLYLHGCLGRATLSDVPRHVDAAIGLLRLRLFSGKGGIEKPFDRIAIESALYQMFLTTAGSWVDHVDQDYQFDTDFWYSAEDLLAHSDLFPDQSASVNSPILGIPLSLFRLVLSAKQMYQGRARQHTQELGNVQDELGEWEALVLRNGDPDSAAAQSGLSHYGLYKDATYLYILIASLLLDQAVNVQAITEGVPEPLASESWQAHRILGILEHHRGDIEWTRCFISNWPLYTCGFFMHSSLGQDVVRQELVLRVKVTGFSQASRFLDELESVWAKRNAARSHYTAEWTPD